MLQRAYSVVNVIVEAAWEKANPVSPFMANSEHRKYYDVSLIDPALTECWVVYGSGLPSVNGTYEYQKDHTKETALHFRDFIEYMTGIGHRNAEANMRQALGYNPDGSLSRQWIKPGTLP